MKIWAFSDLHLTTPAADFHALFPQGIPEADVCVCAGDLFEGRPDDAVAWLDRHIGGQMPVLYVPGNHEFYSRQRSMETNRGLAQRAAYHTDGRVQVLDDMGWTVGGVRFLGSTLWTDFQLFGDTPADIAHAMNAAAGSVSDFRKIWQFDASTRPWSPSDARKQHAESLAWLAREMSDSVEPVVVVSHHAPAIGSLHPEFERDLASAAFVSRLEDVIEQHQPALWIHGHTHSSFDYSIGETRIVCNPRGYELENWSHWRPNMVIELAEPVPRPRF